MSFYKTLHTGMIFLIAIFLSVQNLNDSLREEYLYTHFSF